MIIIYHLLQSIIYHRLWDIQQLSSNNYHLPIFSRPPPGITAAHRPSRSAAPAIFSKASRDSMWPASCSASQVKHDGENHGEPVAKNG